MPSGSKEACCRSKRICTSSEPLPKKGIPCMFLSEIQPHVAQCSPTLKGVPSMFMQGVEKSTPASSKTTVWGAVLATDHPPCARGAIRKECKQKDEGATSTGVKAYLMRALSGNVRSTCRVKLSGSTPKISWGEVTSEEEPEPHRNHPVLGRPHQCREDWLQRRCTCLFAGMRREGYALTA